ncbi:MAG: RNA polymerase sigma factor [Candidatus Pacebacteria bacterium]|nr:RNA polymerase sigma factor [Candidatus Paceibacterota bacterium]
MEEIVLKKEEKIKDEELIRLSIKDPSYFSFIVERYEDAFLRNAYKVLRKKEEAEDVVQETFAKIYLNAKKYQPKEGASFKSWMYKILMNTSFTHYQKQKKLIGKTQYLENMGYNDDEPESKLKDLSEDFDMKSEVRRVIERMPKHLGRLLEFYYFEDLSYEDIAKKEGISVSNLKMRLFRAKRIFKKLSV